MSRLKEWLPFIALVALVYGCLKAEQCGGCHLHTHDGCEQR